MKMVQDGNTYMIDMKDPKNITRMKKIMSQYKIKNDPKRIGPSASATFFKEGTIKIGNNKKIWVKKNSKWQEIKEDVIKKTYNIRNPSKKQIKDIEDMPFVGEFNELRLPAFKLSVEKQKNKTITLNIITVPSFIPDIEVKLF